MFTSTTSSAKNRSKSVVERIHLNTLLLRNGKKVDAFYEKRKYYASKFLQRQEQVRRWLEDVVHTELPQKSTQLAQRLSDGEILCELVNEIRPNAIPKIVRKPEGAEKSYKSMENILSFLRVCRELFKFPEADLFEPIDLFEQKNWIKVIYCLQALASFAKRANPKVKLPPPVEVKEPVIDVPLNLSSEESLSRTAEQQIEAMAAQFDEDEVERFASQADQLRAAEEHLQEISVPTPPNSQPASPQASQVIDLEASNTNVVEPVVEVRPQLRSVGVKAPASSNTPVLLLLGLALWYWLWTINNARGQLHVLERGNLGLDKPDAGPYGAGGVGDHQEMLLRDNDEQISRLHEKTSAIREISEQISIEIGRSSKVIGQVEEEMNTAEGLLATAMQKISYLASAGSSRHICYLVTFVVFIFIVLYFVITRSGRS